MFRISVSGNISAFLTLDGLSPPCNVTQRIYRWGDCIAMYRPTQPWDQQLYVERRVPINTIREEDQLYYIEHVELPTIASVPPCVDDVYDENVTMYTLPFTSRHKLDVEGNTAVSSKTAVQSHITMLEMKNMCIVSGLVSELCKLPFSSEVISCLNKQVVAPDSCRIVQPQPGSLQPTPQQSLPLVQPLVEMSRDQRPRQSKPQLQGGIQHQPRHEPRGAHSRRPRDPSEHGLRRLPDHASRSRGPAGYAPRMQVEAQTESNRSHSTVSHLRQIDRARYHPPHPKVPLSESAVRLRRQPEFVPED